MSDSPAEFSAAKDSSVSLLADPRSTVDRLLQSNDEGRVRAIMRSLSPEQAASIIQFAPGLSDKTRLLASMERRQRAETLDHIAPALFATLVENPETSTDYLLGEVSSDSFRELLSFCSPEQRFYWVSRAAGHDDAAARLLTLLLPSRDLAEMLLAVPDFRKNFVRIRQYEPGQFEEVPCQDRRLKVILQFMADYDTELYKEVIKSARNILDWEHANAEVTEDWLEPKPLVDFEKYERPEAEETQAEAVAAGGEAPPLDAASTDELLIAEPLDVEGLENVPARADFGSLATTGLSPERFQEIQEDLEAMIQREIIDAGGSFAPEALEQASGRVHCYLHFGLVRLGAGSPEKMARLLSERPLHSLLAAGSEYIEAIRQRALRINLLRDWFDREQLLLMEGLLHPRVGTTPGNKTEYIFWLPTQQQKKGEQPTLFIVDARDTIEELAGWGVLAQRMPEGQIRRALASSPAGAQAYLGALAVAVTLYRRWDPELIDLQDVYDFHDRMVDAARTDLTASAKDAIDTAAERWSAAQELNEEEARRVGMALVGAGERLAGWLVRYPRPKPGQCKNWVYLNVKSTR